MNNWKVFYNAYKNVFWGSLLLWYIVFSLFVYFSLKPEIPRGEIFKKSVSPDGNYELFCYRYSDYDWNLYVQVANTDSRHYRVLYNVYHESDVDISWKDNENVSINGIELNVEEDYYEKLKEDE